jgi:hypothetical protein
MRTRLTALAAGLLLAAGCGSPAPDTRPATPEDEKAAEQRIQEEAARELKARRLEEQNRKGKSQDEN